MIYKATSFGVTPLPNLPFTLIRIFLGFGCMMHWEDKTISTSEVPIPKAIAPKAPCVDVCESPQTIVKPGKVIPFSGPTTCTIPFLGSPNPQCEIPYLAEFVANCCNWLADKGSSTGKCWLIVGVLWSAVANVRSGYITPIPRCSKPKKATGLVTSWIKWRSIKKTSGPSSIFRTTWESHTLSNKVVGELLIRII